MQLEKVRALARGAAAKLLISFGRARCATIVKYKRRARALFRAPQTEAHARHMRRLAAAVLPHRLLALAASAIDLLAAASMGRLLSTDCTLT
jgi:hypothetical protein